MTRLNSAHRVSSIAGVAGDARAPRIRDGARPARVERVTITRRERAMKRLILATALLASLGACMSWHPSNDGPARDTAGPPTSGSVAPNGYVAPNPYVAPNGYVAPYGYAAPPPAYMAPVR